MKTFYNPSTMTSYVVDDMNKIIGSHNENRIFSCKCGSEKEIVQHGPYVGLCQRCRRKQYYINNKEIENRKCKQYYKNTNGKERMIERRYSGNYKTVMERDCYSCTICNSKDDLTVHHKDKSGMKSMGSYKISNNSINNLVTLCRSCHSKHHAKEKLNIS